MSIAASSGEHGSVPRTGGRYGVGIITVGEPGTFRLQASKSCSPEQPSPPLQVIATHLIEYNQHGELHARLVEFKLCVFYLCIVAIVRIGSCQPGNSGNDNEESGKYDRWSHECRGLVVRINQ